MLPPALEFSELTPLQQHVAIDTLRRSIARAYARRVSGKNSCRGRRCPRRPLKFLPGVLPDSFVGDL